MADRVRWLGHSTVLVELDGVRALTDPLLRKQVLHLRRAVPLELEESAGLDVVLVSHLHYDHLDLPSLRRLDRDVLVVVPRGAGALVSRQGFRSVVELSAGEEARVGDVTVRAVPAQHGSSRILGTRAEALGYVVAGSRDVYFAGDTDLFPGMADIASGGLDAALVPVGGWGPTLGPGHLDAERAARALAVMRPRLAVPVHWGTYAPVGVPRSAGYLRSAGQDLVRAAARLAPGVEVRVLAPGGSAGI